MSRAESVRRTVLNWRWWVIAAPMLALTCVALPFLLMRFASQALDWLSDVFMASAERADIALGAVSHPMVSWAFRKRASRGRGDS